MAAPPQGGTRQAGLTFNAGRRLSGLRRTDDVAVATGARICLIDSL